MSDLPKKVNILGKIYTITPDTIIGADNTDLASGLCQPWKCAIRVATGQHPQQERDTVLHEVMHGIFSETALTMDFKEDEDEEKIVRRLTTGLLQVLRENPELTKFILKK
jgi:hypothetical protein